MESIPQLALAYALTTSTGVRALIPLVAVSIAAHQGFLHPTEPFGWLGHTYVMCALIIACAFDLVADKVPFVDHVMHVFHLLLKPLAGALTAGATAHPNSTAELAFLIALGAVNAFGIHVAVAGARAATTAVAGGAATPVVSSLEDAGSIGTVVIAFFVPVVAAVLALLFTLLLVLIVRSVYRRLRSRRRRYTRLPNDPSIT
jgi:Domain of unknown function (DUF4126)